MDTTSPPHTAICDSPVSGAPAGARQSGIAKISLSDYRNYASLSLSLEPEPVVLIGENGAGKTNLLEAISLFMPGRGLRRAPVENLTRAQTSQGWRAGLGVRTPGGMVQLGTGRLENEVSGKPGRIVRIDGQGKSGPGGFLDVLRLVWLTPSMDGLFSGPASARRRYLDRIVITYDPSHTKRLNAFERAMRERNRLLETPAPDTSWLKALERQMAEHGTAIAAARRESAARLNSLMAPSGGAHDEAGFPFAHIHVEGLLENELDEFAAVEVEDKYRTILGDSRKTDAAAGRCLQGPHRSDMSVLHGPKNMAAKLCSTGEQKALLIAMTLGQTRMVAQGCSAQGYMGAGPVLLLDEIAAHLDARRRDSLFMTLLDMGVQAFMTGTDEGLFSRLGNKAIFLTVNDGVITRG
ncbi:MAG TPA: DNA replication/repair protein RecF [Rhizobiales bacterium]|nr:DNA replication/repair protein RecF [Hyphomicrobiales bacterium]